MKMGMGRKTSRSFRKRGEGQNIKMDDGWNGSRRRRGGSGLTVTRGRTVLRGARRGERLHGRCEDVAWVRILKWTVAGTVVGGGAAVRRRWSATRGWAKDSTVVAKT
jgi:hypothetical protein